MNTANKGFSVRFWLEFKPGITGVLALQVVVGAAVLAAAGYGAWWWQSGRFIQSTDDAYIGGDIHAISTKASGYIQQIGGWAEIALEASRAL